MIISICIYIRPYIWIVYMMLLWIIDFFCVWGWWFIDIDTYLYGIPFKDDSEGVVSYSLGEVIRYVFHVWGCIRILALD